MPLQNTIHGPVLDTVDALLSVLSPSSAASAALYPFDSAVAGPSETSKVSGHGAPVPASASQPTPPRIVGMLDLPIRHCLVVRKGTRMEDIKWVRSHEQALGQSSIFLARHLPHAKQISYPSTAGAALSLLAPGPGVNGNSKSNGHALYPLDPLGAGAALEDKADEANVADVGQGAAICSKAVMALHGDQLEVLWEGTQAVDDNYTRFLLLTRLSHLELTAALLTPTTAATATVTATATSSSTNPPQSIHSLHTSHSLPSSYFALSDACQLADLVKSYHIVNVHSRPAPVPTTTSLSAAFAESAAPAPLSPSASRMEKPRRDRFPTFLLVEARPIVDREQSGLLGTQGSLVPLGTAGFVLDPS
ncbi:hypothetical protein EHS25_006093 [Saitozyma podzolica]|uniref:Prephenate dehydratase domain-containing protein n=1 Tax=Saitozyma podzolica TaxID=1890683 RepID=A0A427XTJ7_9TREE|nr:hypothetical protein EHS25_006093 [Saitozyma podzolica]